LLFSFVSFHWARAPPHLHSFPTRRSSDLHRLSEPAQRMLVAAAIVGRDFDVPLLEAFGELSGHELRDALEEATRGHFLVPAAREDRKSTRLNSSHDQISYAVFCLKKKKKK